MIASLSLFLISASVLKTSRLDSPSVADRSNTFGLKLAQQLAESDGHNLLISPIGLYMDFAALYAGANGETKDRLQRVFDFPSNDDSGLTNLQAQIKRTGVVNVANSIWTAPRFKVSESYQNAVSQNLDVHSFALRDLGGEGVGQVNRWVNSETDGMIPTLIDRLDPRTVLLLLNAISFEGKWRSPFDPTKTTSRLFTDPEKSYPTPFMQQTMSVNYVRDDNGVQVVSLPYLDGLSMRIALPPKGINPASILASLTSSTLNSATSRVDLKLPKFTYSTTYRLKEALSKLGLDQIFKSANLTLISPQLTRQNTKVSEVVQKAKVEVDEKGTKAAAATSIGIATRAIRAPQKSIELIFDHPFAFSIIQDSTGAILFLGTLNSLKPN